MPKVILPRKHLAPSSSASQPAAPAEPISPPPADAPGPGKEHSERILLLEDEQQTNLVLKEYLQSFGYRVVAVANGVDGLKEVIKSDFELVICDMMMPKLPGDMFYLAVQKTRPQLCNRFVFITGHQGTPKVEAFIAHTKAAILVKPFRLKELEITLEGILSRFPKKTETPSDSLTVLPNGKADAEPASPSRPHSQHQAPGKKDAHTSMVQKALKIVGFIRGTGEKHPPAPKVSPPATSGSPTPRATRRIPNQTVRVTRRIAHLANTPIAPYITPPPPASEPVPPPAIPEPVLPEATQTPGAAPAEVFKKRVTRRIPASLEMMDDLRTKKTADDPTPAPKITRAIPKVTQNIPKVTQNISKVTLNIPKVTRAIPKVTKDIPKVTRAIPKVTKDIPKVTRAIPKVTQNIPKVTMRVSHKISGNLPEPVISRRIGQTKKK